MISNRLRFLYIALVMTVISVVTPTSAQSGQLGSINSAPIMDGQLGQAFVSSNNLTVIGSPGSIAYSGASVADIQQSLKFQETLSPLSGGDYKWHTFYGSPGDDYSQGIAYDGHGGIYITGYSVMSWKGPAGQMPKHPYSDWEDIVIIKLDAAGVYQWHTFYGSAYTDYGQAIVADRSGGVYILARSNRSWDGPAGQPPLHSFTEYDDFTIIKLDAFGNYQWHTFYGSPSDDMGNAISLDGIDGLYITGDSSIPWVGPAGQFPLHSHTGSSDFTLLKLNTAGAYQWHTFYGSDYGEWSQAIALDSNGGIYLAGTAQDSWNGPAEQKPLHDHSGANDIAILKLDAFGAYQWHTFYGSINGDWGFGIALDCRAGVYITGYSADPWIGPISQAPLHAHSGYIDIIIIKLDASGAYQWHTFYGSIALDGGVAISSGGSGGLFVTGSSYETWNGPSGQLPLHPFYERSQENIFILKLNPAGSYQWHTFYGAENSSVGRSIALDGSSWIYLTGNSGGSWNGPDYQPPLHAYSGVTDMFVLKLQAGDAGSTISGKITASDGTPLPGAHIALGLGCSSMTDNQGNYDINDIAAGAYIAKPYMNGYLFLPPSLQINLPPDAVTQDFTSYELVEDIGFRPNPDGYSFSNDGYVNLGDFTGSGFRLMFGDSAVCFPSLPMCSLRFTSAMWREVISSNLASDRCYGMSISSLRFYKDTDLVAGPGSVYSLDKFSDILINWNNEILTTSVHENLGFFSVMQFPDPIRTELDSAFSNTPVEVLTILEAMMANGSSDPLTLLLFHRAADGKIASLTVTPFALSNPQPNQWLVWVYDNNYPNDFSRYVSIYTDTNSWEYNLGTQWVNWSGDASSHNLGVVTTSVHNQSIHCAWCASASSYTVVMIGAGHLLITDSQGRQLGFLGSEYIDQMPVANGIPPILGPEVESEPIYTLPLTETYTILLDGQAFPQSDAASIAQFGPGYAVMSKKLVVGLSTQDLFSISNDGKMVNYHASNDQSPTFSLALEGEAIDYHLEIQGADIIGGRSIRLTADMTTGELVIDGSQLTGGEYNLVVRMLNPSGKYDFYHGNIIINPSDTHLIGFGSWDGVGNLILEIDAGSDGVIDDTIELDNQLKFIFLPIISLNR